MNKIVLTIAVSDAATLDRLRGLATLLHRECAAVIRELERGTIDQHELLLAPYAISVDKAIVRNGQEYGLNFGGRMQKKKKTKVVKA